MNKSLAAPVEPSVIIPFPCYHEKATYHQRVEQVLEIQNDVISIEIIIVDDIYSAKSLAVGRMT